VTIELKFESTYAVMKLVLRVRNAASYQIQLLEDGFGPDVVRNSYYYVNVKTYIND